ncbi:UNVERIFIED_ORG: hypothetical protein GGI66_001588 [Rhizobium esperanzae]
MRPLSTGKGIGSRRRRTIVIRLAAVGPIILIEVIPRFRCISHTAEVEVGGICEVTL